MEPAALLALAAAALSGLPPARPGIFRRVFLVALAVVLVSATVPVGAALGPPHSRSMGERPVVMRVRVEPGDSLWSIARRLLGSRGIEPSASRIDRYWRVLYGANRELIGSDPHLILPGQRLVVPIPEEG